MKQVLTWPEIRGAFCDVAHDCPTISAHWREVYRTWILSPDLLHPDSGDFGAASKKFKAAAKAAVSCFKKKSKFREPWQLWLRLLREYLESHGLGDRRTALDADPNHTVRSNFGEAGRYSDSGSPIYVSGREYALMQQSRDSLYLVRRQLGYSTCDEFTPDHGLYLIHADGRLALDGIIACVAQTSADYAAHLESVESSSNATKRQNFMKPYVHPTRGKPTLAALAYRSGIEQSSLSRWYRGESQLSPANIELLADRLKVKDKEIIPN